MAPDQNILTIILMHLRATRAASLCPSTNLPGSGALVVSIVRSTTAYFTYFCWYMSVSDIAMRHMLEIERKRREEVEGLYHELLDEVRSKSDMMAEAEALAPTGRRNSSFSVPDISPDFSGLTICTEFVHPMDWAPTMGKTCFTR